MSYATNSLAVCKKCRCINALSELVVNSLNSNESM